jgi:hypothetical protein
MVQAMVRELREGWTAVEDSQLWLAMLIGAMEDAVCPERRALPCAGSTLAELGAQLARPMSNYPQGTCFQDTRSQDTRSQGTCPQGTCPQGAAVSSRD